MPNEMDELYNEIIDNMDHTPDINLLNDILKYSVGLVLVLIIWFDEIFHT